MDNEEIIKRIVTNARPHNHDSPRWVVIRDLLCVGSGAAADICRKCGVDPDEVVKKPKRAKE